MRVATDQWFGMQADPTVDATAVIALFLVLAVVGLVPLFAYFRPAAGRRVTATAAAS